MKRLLVKDEEEKINRGLMDEKKGKKLIDVLMPELRNRHIETPKEKAQRIKEEMYYEERHF